MDHLAELRTLISDLAQREQGRAWFPGVTVHCTLTVADQLGTVVDPAFALMAQGRKRVIHGDRLFEYGAGEFLVVSVALPITSQILQASPSAPFLAFGLALRPSVIADLLLQTSASGRGPATPAAIAVSTATGDLLDPVIRLLRSIGAPQDLEVLGPAIEREIHWRLMTGPQGGLVRQIGMADSSLAHVSRAIRWIRAHYDQTLRVDDLAREVGMSVSSLNRHFRAVTATSPLQYQKQIRLQQARVSLLAAPYDVARVGHEVGYDSASQFSREYRRLFGAAPGKDAVRLQSAPMVTGV